MALIGCAVPPEAIDFASDPRILRGAWVGEVEGRPRARDATPPRLELSATYVDRTRYAISGSFRVGSEPPRQIRGTVHGNSAHAYVRPQGWIFVPPRVEGEISVDGVAVWALEGWLNVAEPIVSGKFGRADDDVGQWYAFRTRRAGSG